MRFPYGETVARLRAPLVFDPYSGQTSVEDWDSADELELPEVAVAPTLATELHTADGVRVETAVSIYTSDEFADVRHGDRIRRRDGSLWSVEGDLVAWVNPLTGWAPGATAPIKRIE